MNIPIELYKGAQSEYFGTTPLLTIVQKSMEMILRQRLDKAVFNIQIHGVPDETEVPGLPLVENLIPEYGYLYVRVTMGNYIIYQHPHPLSDIVTHTLQMWLKQNYPDVSHWKFRIALPGIPQQSSMRATPSVENSAFVESLAEGEKPAFNIKRVAEPEPPIQRLANFGMSVQGPEWNSKVKVLVTPQLEKDLNQMRSFSPEVEEGGFLVGKLYRDGDNPGGYLLEVIEALPAEQTGASLLHFTFTGDSFAGIKRTLRQHRPNERILGWYHTHLFPATKDFGLSSIDLTLHFGTFTFPWQLAGLINIDGHKRKLRFYTRQGNEMELCSHWVTHERP